jgi:hypothetical protein
MSEVKLELGWLTRDVMQATQQTSAWNSQKSQSARPNPAKQPAPESVDDKAKQAAKSK